MPQYYLARLLRSRRGPAIAAAAVTGLAIVVGVTIFAVASDNDDTGTGAGNTTPSLGQFADRTTTTSDDGATATTRDTANVQPTTTTSSNGPPRSTVAGGGSSSGSSTTTSGSGPSATVTTVVQATDLEKTYLAAWKAECNRIWGFSTNGAMYDPDDATNPLSLNICLESMDSVFMSATTAIEADRQGTEDARTFLYNSTSSGLVCWIDPSTEEITGCYDTETDTTGPLTIGN